MTSDKAAGAVSTGMSLPQSLAAQCFARSAKVLWHVGHRDMGLRSSSDVQFFEQISFETRRVPINYASNHASNVTVQRLQTFCQLGGNLFFGT